MDVQPAHRSRRSFPNLQHLSLAPLSSRFPIDGDDFEAEPEESARVRLSYIQGKSAPTTPSILSESRSSSRTPRSRSKPAKRRGRDHYFSPDLEISDVTLTKAKSAVGLVDAPARPHHVRRKTGDGSLLSPTGTRHVPRKMHGNDDEWLQRAGMIMSAQATESKGQSWLASRESSTSLVAHTISGEHMNEDEHALASPHVSRAQSRVHSRMVSRVGRRAPSTRTSRRGSMVATGSRVGFMTSIESKTPGAMSSAEGYFDDVDDLAEPDFVDEECDDTDEEEVSRLAQQKGFGIGGLVDRLVGFSLFNVEEDAEETEDDAELSKEDALKKRQAALKKRREELARAAKHSAEAASRAEADVPNANKQDEGGWQDAAWLLSVASKVLY
jgi:hypothetical protein